MLRAGALMAALLVLVPFTDWSIRGRLLVLCEVWPGHLKQYQQLSIATDDAYKTLVNSILEQSALNKDNRIYKSFRTSFKIHGKNAFKNHQQKYAVLFKINLYLIADKKTNIQISKKHLITHEVILKERNYLRRRLNILMNANLEDCEVKMNWHINMRKKSEGNKSHISYFENGYKCMEIRSPVSYMTYQINILRGEEQLPKSQKSLGNTIMLKFLKQHKGEEHIETNILKKKKCKNNIERLLASVKEKFCKANTNVYNKNQHRIFCDGKKIFNTESKDQYIGFKSLQEGKNVIEEKIKMWKHKTITKKSVFENQKLQFRRVFTYQKNSHRLLNIYSTYKTMLSYIQRKKVPAFQTKTYRGKHPKKWDSILRAKKSKFGENEMGILSKNYYLQPSIINLKFLTITMYVKQDFFSSEKYQTKPLVQVKKTLQYQLQSSERIKKYFHLGQKGLEISILKTLMVKQLVKREGFPAWFYFYKDIFNGPSPIVERTKRSAKNKTVSVSVDVLQHLSSALIAGATIFGIALFIIALAGFYLYLKRRQLLTFFNTVLKDGRSSPKSASTNSQSHAPISVSQNFHFVQPKNSRKKQPAVSAAVEACTKEKSDRVNVKEIYDSSDTEGSSKMSHKGLTVRSRAYVFPSCSSGSIQSFCDDVCDVCSEQLSLSDEIVGEKLRSNLSSATPKEKEAVPVACKTNHCSKDNQSHCTNTDVSPQLKKLTISRSKSQNDIIRASSSNISRPVQSLTHISKVENP